MIIAIFLMIIGENLNLKQQEISRLIFPLLKLLFPFRILIDIYHNLLEWGKMFDGII